MVNSTIENEAMDKQLLVDSNKDPDKAIIINAILCYISTARHTMKRDEIIRICMTFYSSEDIKNGKDKLFAFVSDTPKRRRGEYRLNNEINDILDTFEKCFDENIKLPIFVADSYNSLPQSSGFDIIAQHMISLVDEINDLKKEIDSLNKSRLIDEMIQKDLNIMQEDILSIKGEVKKLNHNMVSEDLRRKSFILSELVTGRQSISHNLSPTTPTFSQSDYFFERIGNTSTTAVGPIQDNDVLLIKDDNNDISVRPKSKNPNTPSKDTKGNVLSKKSALSQDSLKLDVENLIENIKKSPDATVDDIGNFQNKIECGMSVQQDKKDENKLSKNNNETDEEGFTLVRKSKKKNKIFGSKQTNESLKSATKIYDLYIGNCDTNITSEILSKYIYDETNVKVLNCIELQTKYETYNSFKVSLNVKDREKLLLNDVWPEGIVCRKFYNNKKINK